MFEGEMECKSNTALPEVYKFPVGDLQVRCEELELILSRDDKVGVAAPEIRRQWSSYLSALMEPSDWLAFLYNSPQRGQGMEEKVEFVDVVQVHFNTLEASVEILRLDEEEDSEISDNTIIVSLLDLKPVKNQRKDGFNGYSVAKALDHLQFFYQYLWKPWDVKDEESEDWLQEHLENRINLLTLDPNDKTSIMIKRAEKEVLEIQKELSDLDLEDVDMNKENQELKDEEEEDEEKILSQLNLAFREDNIRKEMEILENSNLRKAKFNLDNKLKSEKHPEGLKKICLVLSSSTPEDIRRLMDYIYENYGNYSITFHESLNDAVSSTLKNDIICITPGVHEFNLNYELRDGITLRGIDGPKENIIITGDRFHDENTPLFEFYSGSTKMENLTLKSELSIKSHQIISVTEEAELELANVDVVNGSIGILSGGTRSHVKIIGCNIRQCETGVAVNSGTFIINESVVEGCENGMVINAGSELTAMTKVDFVQNSKRDIYVHCAANSVQKMQEGDLTLLDSVSSISNESCSILGNVTLTPNDAAVYV